MNGVQLHPQHLSYSTDSSYRPLNAEQIKEEIRLSR